MISLIFENQIEFIEYWDNIYHKEFNHQNKESRLQFFRMFKDEVHNFYYHFIDHNIWQIQRAYYFAFWIGILYINNVDCIMEIEMILFTCNIYKSFKKIVEMLNNKVKRTILRLGDIESKIIFGKMMEFQNLYSNLELKINKIKKFYRQYSNRRKIINHVTIINAISPIFPLDIVFYINNYYSK